MTEALELSDGDRVIEIVTGSGYQVAHLSLMTPLGRVVTMNRILALAHKACGLLQGLGYHKVAVKQAGALLGCPFEGLYDAIIVTVAAPRLPASLLSPLAVGGRLMAPVGTLSEQEFVQVRLTDEGL